MTPKQQYQEDINSGKIEANQQQAIVVNILEDIYHRYVANEKKKFSRKLHRIFDMEVEPIQGLYLYGGVGIGKTYLMDLFYYNLPGRRKMRLHFHRFMRETHQRLKALQGEYDPLEIIAKEIAEANSIICFDEFFVSEIGDAMILATLIKHLFKRGVALVTTSNIKPDDLYENGLQRSQFLPVIDYIKKYTQIHAFDSGKDFRLHALKLVGVYFTPLNSQTKHKLEQTYQSITKGCKSIFEPLWIESREIKTVKYSNSVAWFDFAVLCNTPRSQTDYLELAQNFTTIILSNVPIIKKEDDKSIVYLIYLIDILYDNHVKLVISAEGGIDEIYPADGRLGAEFRRTKSRLQEMQSERYLALPHLRDDYMQASKTMGGSQ